MGQVNVHACQGAVAAGRDLVMVSLPAAVPLSTDEVDLVLAYRQARPDIRALVADALFSPPNELLQITSRNR
jgi:hypothetical protein